MSLKEYLNFYEKLREYLKTEEGKKLWKEIRYNGKSYLGEKEKKVLEKIKEMLNENGEFSYLDPIEFLKGKIIVKNVNPKNKIIFSGIVKFLEDYYIEKDILINENFVLKWILED